MNPLLDAIKSVAAFVAEMEGRMPSDHGRFVIDLAIRAAPEPILTVQIDFRGAIQAMIPEADLAAIRNGVQRHIEQATRPDRFVVAVNFTFVSESAFAEREAMAKFEGTDVHVAT